MTTTAQQITTDDGRTLTITERDDNTLWLSDVKGRGYIAVPNTRTSTAGRWIFMSAPLYSRRPGGTFTL